MSKNGSPKGVICKTFLDSKGNIRKRIFYKDGERVASKLFSKEGNSTIEGTLPDGLVREYYDDLDIIKWEVNYTDGKRDGEYKEYYLDKQIEQSIIFKQDKRNGMTKRYSNNGTLILEADFKDGKHNGIFRKFNLCCFIRDPFVVFIYLEPKMRRDGPVYFTSSCSKSYIFSQMIFIGF